MTKKKAKSKGQGPRQPVQSQAMGPTHRPAQKNKINGRDETGTTRHHFSEFMGRKTGMNSPADRHACDAMAKPMSNVCPVIPTRRLIAETGTTDYPPRPGMLLQRRFTVPVVVGTGKFGIIGAYNGTSGWTDASDMFYSLSTYAGLTFPAMNEVGISPHPSMSVNGISAASNSAHWKTTTTLGMRFTVVANEQAAANRDSVAYAISLPGQPTGLSYATIQGEVSTREFQASVFADGEQINVLMPRSASAYSTATAGNVDGLDTAVHRGWTGLLFYGTAGAIIDVQVEVAVFYSGINISPSVVPIVSDNAVACAMTCLLLLQSRGAGTTNSENGRYVARIHEEAEMNTVATVPRALLSAAWPVVKQLASTAGTSLLRSVLGFLA
jgi:hypothetical protein